MFYSRLTKDGIKIQQQPLSKKRQVPALPHTLIRFSIKMPAFLLMFTVRVMGGVGIRVQ